MKREDVGLEELCASLVGHVRRVEGERNPFTAPTKHREVRDYVEERLGSVGAGTLRPHPFTWQRVEGVNLVFQLPGQEEGRPALIGAHYDSVPGSPGADDNASGVAVLLELAKLLCDGPPRRPVWLVAFDLEEWNMRGSKALARELKEDGLKPSWMASLEMVGCRRRERGTQRYPFPFNLFYTDRADFILFLGNTRAHRLLVRMAKVFQTAGVKTERFTVPFNGWAIPPTRFSDQAPFWDIGVAGVMITDTAWFRNPNYHKPTDTMDTLDFTFMGEITMGLATFLRTR